MKRAQLICIFALLFALAAPVAQARSVYFVGNTSSNFTVDLTTWHVFRNNYQSTGGVPLTFNAGAVRCQVLVLNTSQAQQTITDQTKVKLNIELPSSSNWTYVDTSPVQDSTNTDIPYVVTGAGASGATMARTFTNTNGQTYNTAVSLPVTLDPNQGALIETVQGLMLSAQYLQGWLTPGTGSYPYVKMHQTCTGVLDITDTTPGTPGYVMAQGLMTHLADSYQQFPLQGGGIVTRTRNDSLVSGNLTARVDVAAEISVPSDVTGTEAWVVADNGNRASVWIHPTGAAGPSGQYYTPHYQNAAWYSAVPPPYGTWTYQISFTPSQGWGFPGAGFPCWVWMFDTKPTYPASWGTAGDPGYDLHRFWLFLMYGVDFATMPPCGEQFARFTYRQWSRYHGNISCNYWGRTDLEVDNKYGRTSFEPAHVHSAPIVINGGQAI